MTPSVNLPGGEQCFGKSCKAVKNILGAGFSTKKRYNIPKAKKKEEEIVEDNTENVVKTKEEDPAPKIVVKEHIAGQEEKKTYEGIDNPKIRKALNIKPKSYNQKEKLR